MTAEPRPEGQHANVPAPGLAEVAEIWWDRDIIPVVHVDDDHRRFFLLDPADPDCRILLAELEHPTNQPDDVARALAEGLAACDFPPTENRASVPRVAATLRVAGRSEVPITG